ncbi:MAG: hypothetical protein AAB267_04995 [Candidatus Desantisbacteria bacterium]
MKFFKILFLLAIGFSITPLLVSVSNKKPPVRPSISELEKIRGEKEEILSPPAKQPQNIEPRPQREPCPCGRK